MNPLLGAPIPPSAEEADKFIANPKAQRFTEEGRAVLREVFLSNRAGAEAILCGMADPVPTKEALKVMADEADALVETIKDRMQPCGLVSLKALYLRDPEAARKLAAAVPPLPPGTRLPPPIPPPPRPMHQLPGDPGYDPAPTDKTAEQKRFVEEIKKEGKFTTFSAAWNEAQRRRPALFR